MEAAEQATAARPASLASSCAKKPVSGHPPCAPRGQQAGNVTGVGDALNACRHKVRRSPSQTVQQRLEIDDGKKLRTAKAENLHGITPSILSNAHNSYLKNERRSRKFDKAERLGKRSLPGRGQYTKAGHQAIDYKKIFPMTRLGRRHPADLRSQTLLS
ncbi:MULTISPECIES: hypothetical protein [unclassified Bradyrhizobium]|uniref:hypothetical protein n=1 Tax=unclassified Bradyrhizobium TaxID=2631580 RepID=UPI0028E808D1|nr:MULTISPECIES: hypothetical protein [unclassified Bradyrhizobium]